MTPPGLTDESAGLVKRHNVCKRHIAIDTGFKQAELCTIFLHIISMWLKL